MRRKMKALKFTQERIASMRDAYECMIITQYNNETYTAFVDITGIREALENNKRGIIPLIDKAKKQFSEEIINSKVKPSDRIKYCFWSDGDFIIYPNETKNINLTAYVSKYGGDRLHIEIPKKYRDMFNEADEVKIIKK